MKKETKTRISKLLKRQKKRTRRLEHYEIMVKEIYHTTRLGIQTGFGVIGIASSFCRRSFYYLDFFRLGYFIYICCIFLGRAYFFCQFVHCVLYECRRDTFRREIGSKGSSYTESPSAHGGNFHVFFNLLCGELIWWPTHVLQHWEARGIVRFTDHEELRLQGRRLLLINDV